MDLVDANVFYLQTNEMYTRASNPLSMGEHGIVRYHHDNKIRSGSFRS